MFTHYLINSKWFKNAFCGVWCKIIEVLIGSGYLCLFSRAVTDRMLISGFLHQHCQLRSKFGQYSK